MIAPWRCRRASDNMVVIYPNLIHMSGGFNRGIGKQQRCHWLFDDVVDVLLMAEFQPHRSRSSNFI